MKMAEGEKLGRAGVAAKTMNGVWLNWENWRELLEKIHGTKEIEKHQRKMNQILLEERQLHGRSVEKLMNEKKNLEINGFKIQLEKDSLKELVKMLTNKNQELERGLSDMKEKQADQDLQLKSMKRDLEKAQEDLAKEAKMSKEAKGKYSQVLDENTDLRKRNKEMEGLTQNLEKSLEEATEKLAGWPPDTPLSDTEKVKRSEKLVLQILNKMGVACRDHEDASTKECEAQCPSWTPNHDGQANHKPDCKCSNTQCRLQGETPSAQRKWESENWIPRKVVESLQKFLLESRMPEQMIPLFTDLILETSQAWRSFFRQRIKKVQQQVGDEIEEHKRRLNRRASYKSAIAKEKVAYLQKELKESKSSAQKLIHSFTR